MSKRLSRIPTTDGICILHPVGWRGLLFFEGGKVRWFLRWLYYCIRFKEILPYGYGSVGVPSSYRLEVVNHERLRDIASGGGQ